MSEQFRHGMLPEGTHDELARETFVQALKTHIANEVTPGIRDLYQHKVLPKYKQNTGVAPSDRQAIRHAMEPEPYYQLWSSVRRSSQELLWNSVADSIDRQLPELKVKASKYAGPSDRLILDPNFELPWYFWGIDIHVMPGGYRSEYTPGDIFAGALYDRGVYVYAQGQMGELNDDYGQSVVQNFLKKDHPQFRPKRILEMGCGMGNSLLPYVDAFPEAEVHGVDVGPSLLRYGHARAESLGKRVYFSQQNAESTNFPDQHFDLIVSHILLHELPPAAVRNVLHECHRLLAPGGMMVHADFPGYAEMDNMTQFLIDWDTRNNNEPFWGPMRDMDVMEATRAAGFNSTTAGSNFAQEVKVPTGRILQSGQQASSGNLNLLVGQK